MSRRVTKNRAHTNRAGACLGALILWMALPAAAQPGPAKSPLDEDQLRDGLRKRGLMELLEFQLGQSPPADRVAAALLRREVLLANLKNPTRTLDQRQADLEQATAILRQLIADDPDDPRALTWRLELGQSLVYQHGEPYYAAILYRGGTEPDREALAGIMAEAITTFDALLALLQVEFARLDSLHLAEYERLERSGYIERIERLEPQTQYLRRWALFYRSLARKRRDPRRLDEFRAVSTELRDRTDLLTTPHAVSHYQVQSLLLAGMCHRRLGDYAQALQELELAMDVADRIAHPSEQRDVAWAATLASLERARALAGARQYDQALRAVDDFRVWVADTAPGNFGFQLVAALLEGSVYRAQARRASAAGNATLARRLNRQALAPLIVLAQRDDANRDAIYADLYANLPDDIDPTNLHPFERSAVIAGLLRESEALAKTQVGQAAKDAEHRAALRVALLDRAIDIAQLTLADPSELDGQLHAEVLYNLAVAQYRRGMGLEASRTFARVAQRFGDFRWAESAATLAVQTASELYRDPSLAKTDRVGQAYLHALELLTDRFSKSQAAAYWLYFRAQVLDDMDRLQEAARFYGKVRRQHEHYVHARFGRVRCLARVASKAAERGDADPASVTRLAATAMRAAGQFAEQVRQGLLQLPDAPLLQRLLAESVLHRAEVAVLPRVNKFRPALEALDGFEERHPQAADLIGRVLRVRIIAYEGLGLLDQAEQEIPRFIDSDPTGAGATLQALFDAINAEISALRRSGRTGDADRKAQSALLLAEQLDRWADRPESALSTDDHHALKVQLADACLAAGRLDRALTLYQALRSHRAEDARASRITFGLAETLAKLGRHDQALPLYNRLYRRLQPDTPLWWEALLGDLTCRSELGQDPDGIVKAIEQRRFLYRNRLGGPELRPKFQALLEQNRRAADSAR
ncbi:MAG: hypothetical protein ACE5GE_05905 [Phycisphaerae bacterium]